MPEHLSMTQLAGGAVLVLACGAWLVGLTRALRRSRPGAGYVVSGRRPHSLSALPSQRPPAPALETVELTPAEQAEFACLVRRLTGGR